MTEKDFQQAVREYAEAQGWSVWFTFDSRHSTAGDPDLRMVRGHTGTWQKVANLPARAIVCELKFKATAQGGAKNLTPEQYEALYLWGQVPGVEAYLWTPDDWDEIERALG